MDAKQESVPRETYSEKVDQAKAKGKKQAFKRKQTLDQQNSPTYTISDQERDIGRRMLPLLTNPAFKALDEFENHHIADAMARALEPPPQAWFPFQNASFGELMAFKRGFNIALQVLRLGRQNLMQQILDEQAAQSRTKQEASG